MWSNLRESWGGCREREGGSEKVGGQRERERESDGGRESEVREREREEVRERGERDGVGVGERGRKEQRLREIEVARDWSEKG